MEPAGSFPPVDLESENLPADPEPLVDIPPPVETNLPAEDGEKLLVESENLPAESGNLLVDEAENAFSTGESTGESTGGRSDLPPIEFSYGKVMKDGRWQKTGKIYWIFTVWSNGSRRRISPTAIYGKVKGLTSIEKCPFKGRVFEFYRRSLSVESTGGANVPAGPGTGLSGSEESTTGG